MFGLGMGEIIIIAVLALLLLGPDRLPEAAKQLGKTLREVKKHTDDLKDQFESELYAEERGAAKPALVPPVPVGKPAGPAEPPPPATVENVPGLEAALAGDEPPPAPAAVVAAAEPAAAAPATTEKAAS